MLKKSVIVRLLLGTSLAKQDDFSGGGSGGLASRVLAGFASSKKLLYVSGALDVKFTAVGQRIFRENEGARHVILPGVGHSILEEQPAGIATLMLEAAGVSGSCADGGGGAADHTTARKEERPSTIIPTPLSSTQLFDRRIAVRVSVKRFRVNLKTPLTLFNGRREKVELNSRTGWYIFVRLECRYFLFFRAARSWKMCCLRYYHIPTHSHATSAV